MLINIFSKIGNNTNIMKIFGMFQSKKLSDSGVISGDNRVDFRDVRHIRTLTFFGLAAVVFYVFNSTAVLMFLKRKTAEELTELYIKTN